MVDMLASARRQGYDFELLSKPVHPADLLAKVESVATMNFPVDVKAAAPPE
jgi:hypothetical protein